MKNSTKATKKTFFYGWVIVVACMLIQAVPFGIAANIQPAFTNFVTSGEGFTFTQFSLIFTIGTVVSAVCSPFIGNLYSKPNANVKLLYIIGSLILGCGFAAFSLAGGNIYAYYALSVLVQVGSAIISSIGVPTLINGWFKENKGIAMGLAFSGGGLGNMVLQILAGSWLNNPAIGYKGAYLRFGILALAVSLPIAILIIRMPKSQDELNDNTSKKKINIESNSKSINDWGYTFAEVTKMKAFWVLAVSFLFVGLYVGGMALQFIPYFQGLEASGEFTMPAATVASAFGFFSIFGNLSGGVLFDKFGVVKSLALAGVLVVTCGLCLIFAPKVNVLGYVFSICLGIAMFSYIIGPSYITGALFGNKEFGTILGIIQIFFALGFGSGSTLFGFIVDKAGFIVGWISTIVYAIIAYSGLVFATSSIIKMNKKNNVEETKKIA